VILLASGCGGSDDDGHQQRLEQNVTDMLDGINLDHDGVCRYPTMDPDPDTLVFPVAPLGTSEVKREKKITASEVVVRSTRFSQVWWNLIIPA
jgi:hypothetical protein